MSSTSWCNIVPLPTLTCYVNASENGHFTCSYKIYGKHTGGHYHVIILCKPAQINQVLRGCLITQENLVDSYLTLSIPGEPEVLVG